MAEKIDEKVNFEIMELTSEEIGEMEQVEIEIFKEEIRRKLAMIPISDDLKHHLYSIAMLYQYQKDFYEISVSDYLVYLFRALYYNLSMDDIDKEIVLDGKDEEKIIKENVKELVSQFNERFIDSSYRDFFIDILRKLLYKLPMLSNITFQDDQWEFSDTTLDMNKDYKMYYHKESAQVFKKVYDDGREEIFQSDYFVYEDNEYRDYYCDSNSTININGYLSWNVGNAIIRKKDIQKFLIECKIS